MTSLKVPGLTRQNLDDMTVGILRPGERTRPEVRLVEVDGRRYVVKDFEADSTAFKHLLGTYLVWRERIALQRAAGISGVQRLAGQLGPSALVTEYVDAPEATSAPPEWLTVEFFERLATVIDQLHARGVVHGDLKKLENILVTSQGEPLLLDFASAFQSGSNPLTALVFPWISDDDAKAISKLKRRCAPHLLTQAEARRLDETTWTERAFRWIRRYVRYAVKVFSTPEHRRASIRLK